MNWKENLIETGDGIAEVVLDTERIAVLGIKPESHAMQPAFYVPKYMQNGAIR